MTFHLHLITKYQVHFSGTHMEHKYLSMKEGNLFVLFYFVCTYEIHQIGMLQITFLVFLESSWRGGVHLVHGVWTCSAKILEYWMISSLKIKLHCSWKFWRNWNVPSVGNILWARFSGIYLERLGFKMWEILNFKWLLPLTI
jgi:hypothetical protein